MNLDIELMEFVTYFLLMFILYFLSVFSKRLGEAMNMKKYYYIYYVGMFFIFLSSIASFASNEFGYNRYIFLAIGLTLGLVTTIKYWAWLIKELVKG